MSASDLPRLSDFAGTDRCGEVAVLLGGLGEFLGGGQPAGAWAVVVDRLLVATVMAARRHGFDGGPVRRQLCELYEQPFKGRESSDGHFGDQEIDDSEVVFKELRRRAVPPVLTV